MVRLELIANRSVEDDLYDLFGKQGLTPDFTKLPEVHGRGNSGPRRGDHIFPEENFVLIMYCDEHEVEGIARAVHELKLVFPTEGIRLYRTQAERVC